VRTLAGGKEGTLSTAGRWQEEKEKVQLKRIRRWSAGKKGKKAGRLFNSDQGEEEDAAGVKMGVGSGSKAGATSRRPLSGGGGSGWRGCETNEEEEKNQMVSLSEEREKGRLGDV